MAGSLQARVAARGFPVIDIGGQSGQGALPDSTLPAGNAPGQPTATWTDPNVDPGSVPAVLPAPEAYVLGQVLWGLSGATNPDDTPRTHAAPIADPTLGWHKHDAAAMTAYSEELEAAHGPEFTGVELREHPPTNRKFGFGQQLVPGNGVTNLQPLYKQPISSNAGYDAVQGYGGGGDGPGGTNATMPLTVLDRQFPGPEGHPTFVSAAEVPLITTAAIQFIPDAPEFGSWLGGGFDGPTAQSSAQQPVTADTPATGPAVGAGAGLLPSWGSLGG